MSEYTDKELLELFRKSENPHYAFNLLVQKYQRRVYNVIRRLLLNHDDTNDVMQNTFIKVWKGLPEFREESQLYSWIFRIATNESLSFLKSSKKNLLDVLDEEINHPSVKEKFKEDPDAEEIQKRLQEAMLQLPEKQRIVFQMKYYDEMKYEEMSAVLDTSVGALKASYHIAVKKIEEILTKELNHS
jgi:RNA polymerase sigma factor (sigma-70 family)